MATYKQELQTDIGRLTSRWRRIERLLKRVERVQEAAAIASINELRYAGRQIFEIPAFFVRDNPELSSKEKKWVRNRLIIAEQYLNNAEHDSVDSIVRFFAKVTREVNERFGKQRIVEYYHDYNLFLDQILECLTMIEETRVDASKRSENYNFIIASRFDAMIDCYNRFLDAEVSARLSLEQREHERELQARDLDAQIKSAVNEAQRIRGVNRLLTLISVVGTVVTVLSLGVAFFMWRHSYAEVCTVPVKAVYRVVCPII